MTDDQFRDLVNLYIDNEISEDDLARLKAEVEYDSRRRDLFRRYCHMNEATRRVMDEGEPASSGRSQGKRRKHSGSRSKQGSRSQGQRKSRQHSEHAVASNSRNSQSSRKQSRGGSSGRKHSGDERREPSSRRSRAQEEVIRTGARDTYLKGLQSLAKWGALAACLAFVVKFGFNMTERHHAEESAVLEAELAGRTENPIHPAYMFAGVQVEDERDRAAQTKLPPEMDSLDSLTAYPLGIADGGAWPSAKNRQTLNPDLAKLEQYSETSDIEKLARSLRERPASSLITPVSMDLDLVPAKPKPKPEPVDYAKQIEDAKSRMDALEAEAMKAFEDGEFEFAQ